MNRLAIFLSLFFVSGCTVYTEKQSEAVSQNVYATDDALQAARVDLAYNYSALAKSFIKPPKHRIKIDSVYTLPTAPTNNSTINMANVSSNVLLGLKTKPIQEQTPTTVNQSNTDQKIRIAIVPDVYKSTKVVVVGSDEYKDLLKDKNINKQLTQDNINFAKAQKLSEEEHKKQAEMRDKLVQDNQKMQVLLAKKDLAILWRNIIIVTLLLLIGGFTYLKLFVMP